MEFTGHKVRVNGNQPAQLNNSLLKTMPDFKISRDVASFLGFLNFHSMFIPYFKQRVALFCLLVAMDMYADVTGLITHKKRRACSVMILDIVSDPCVARYDFKKRPYLLTDFFETWLWLQFMPT